LGKSFPYWVELEAQAKSLKYYTLILEIDRLRVRVLYHESRMIETPDFKKAAGVLTAARGSIGVGFCFRLTQPTRLISS